MLDSQSLDDLGFVRKIREKIRKWWRLEIAFADTRGYVTDHASGVVKGSHNDFCQAALHSPEGFRRCNRSIVQATQAVTENPKPEVGIIAPCHLGFPIAMAPVL